MNHAIVCTLALSVMISPSIVLADEEKEAAPEEDALSRAMREAQEAFGAGDDPSKEGTAIKAVQSTTEVNGYVNNRFTFSWVNVGAPIPTRDLQGLNNLIEANLQLRRPLWKEAFAYVDASAFLQMGGYYVQAGPNGERQNAANHDVLTTRPAFVLSEAYLSYSPVENLNLMLGKKRVVWGPGMANNPTDLMNPGRDPSDPNLQRAGAVLAKLEIPTEYLTFSTVFSPKILYQQSGLPYQFLVYPTYPSYETLLDATRYPDQRDNEAHYLVAARAYMLLFESDINFIYYYSNLYNDTFKNKSRLGMTFSRYFFTFYELHAELLLTEGTARQYVNGDCVNDVQAAQNCVVSQTALFSEAKKDNGVLYPRLLVGSRTQLADESSISLEYLYVGDGYTPSEFQNFVRGISTAKMLNVGQNLSPAAGTSQGGLVPRLSFDPLRRHYLFLTYTKPKIFDDFSVTAVLIAGLEDLSGVFTPSVTWNALEWLNLQLNVFLPIRGLNVNPVEAYGRKYDEYGLFPYDWRVFFEARAFY